jgi:thioredoxin 1
MSKSIELNTLNFQNEVIDSKKMVLVDFWATWCVPCKTTEPMVDEIAVMFRDKVKVGKVNVETNADLANRYSVRGVPTFLIFKNGEVIDQITSGTLKKDIFQEILENHLKE